jgi:hypothetical protein
MPVVEDSKIGLFAPNKNSQLNPTLDAEGRAAFLARQKSAISGSGDPKESRLLKAGLQADGTAITSSMANGTPSVGFDKSGEEWRVRVSVAPAAKILYRDPNPGVMSFLKDTDGVIFPYVPQVTVAYQARYGSQPLTHSNYTNYFYEASEVQAIQINGEFSVQNEFDAQYLLGVLYFFRAATKMFYGNSGIYQGSPPPILYLDGYGAHYLPHVPCLLTQFSHTMPNDVDYLETTFQGKGTSKTTIDTVTKLPVTKTEPGRNYITTETGELPSKTRLPTVSTISITLQPVYSRTKQREFDFNAFARGDMITKGML